MATDQRLHQYVALLRGIGPMDPRMRNANLRAACEALGLANVSTVVSSGNVVFGSPSADVRGLESTLEAAWLAKLGFSSTTIVRRREELEALVALRPFGTLEHGPSTYLLVTFAKSPLPRPIEVPARPPAAAYELVAARERELFTVSDTTSSLDVDVMRWIEGRFGKGLTSRTWLTVARILRRMS